MFCASDTYVLSPGMHVFQKLPFKILKIVCLPVSVTAGRKMPSKDVEEDQFGDILTLMEMLTNLLSKDFIDFSYAGRWQ